MEKRYTYKPYSLRLKEYEEEEHHLYIAMVMQRISADDYEKAVQKLAETLDI